MRDESGGGRARDVGRGERGGAGREAGSCWLLSPPTVSAQPHLQRPVNGGQSKVGRWHLKQSPETRVN